MKKRYFCSNAETADVCTELGYLLHAGIGGADALTLLAEDETKPALKSALEEMARRADDGLSLGEVFGEAGCFPGQVSRMLTVGEKTGRTEEALEALAADCGAKAELEGRLKSALLYPSILLLIMLAVIAVLLVYVLPVFQTVYAQLGGSLTGIAGGLLNFGRGLGRGMPVLIALFCAAAVFLTLFSAVPAFRGRILSAWQARRGDKGLSGRMNAAAFARGMALAMASGMETEEAVESAAGLIPSEAESRKKAEACVEALRGGAETAAALRESGLVPPGQCRILEAGIRGGAGEIAMDRIARRLTEESEQAMEDALSRVEPAMVIVTSLLVGVILLSVMLPLVHILSAIG